MLKHLIIRMLVLLTLNFYALSTDVSGSAAAASGSARDVAPMQLQVTSSLPQTAGIIMRNGERSALQEELGRVRAGSRANLVKMQKMGLRAAEVAIAIDLFLHADTQCYKRCGRLDDRAFQATREIDMYVLTNSTLQRQCTFGVFLEDARCMAQNQRFCNLLVTVKDFNRGTVADELEPVRLVLSIEQSPSNANLRVTLRCLGSLVEPIVVPQPIISMSGDDLFALSQPDAGRYLRGRLGRYQQIIALLLAPDTDCFAAVLDEPSNCGSEYSGPVFIVANTQLGSHCIIGKSQDDGGQFDQFLLVFAHTRCYERTLQNESRCMQPVQLGLAIEQGRVVVKVASSGE